MYRRSGAELEVFLVHPGGPFWKNKDDGSWDIPKGQIKDGEELLDAAKREFNEETGFEPVGDLLELGSVERPGGLVYTWAFEGDADPKELKSNTTFITWPPKSGQRLEIPEVDRGDFFPLEVARQKILKYELPLLDALAQKLKES